MRVKFGLLVDENFIPVVGVPCCWWMNFIPMVGVPWH